ncbi:hypothetical protein ALT1545_20030 [Alteromonas macleodii]
MGEHRPYKARVTGSSPVASTIPLNISQSSETQQSNYVLVVVTLKHFGYSYTKPSNHYQ